MPEDSKHGKGLLRLMTFGTALAFGILAAIIVSMGDFIGGNATFEFSYRTTVAFVLGCFVGWLFWWFIRRRSRKAREQSEP